MQWKFTKTDGNPTEEGEYRVILLYPKKAAIIDGRLQPAEGTQLLACSALRFFGKKNPVARATWAMYDQDPDADMYWHEKTGSRPGESVYAWMDDYDLIRPLLPEGVEWE